MTLRPEMPFKGDSRAAFYSFEEGILRTLSDESDVDLFVYYDGNDCAGGALIGHWDDPGWLYPVDGETWREALDAGPPPADSATVDAVSPLDSTQEGRFIWVKTESGVFYLVRIGSVVEATYENLLAGQMAEAVLEWRGPFAGE